MTTTHTIMDSPVGELTLVAVEGTLSGVYFPGHWTRPDPASFGERRDRGFEEAQLQLGEYLAGARSTFELAVSRTEAGFERKVWGLIEGIPYGETTTYGDLARVLGDVSLARAVGRATGHNPLSIIVPCHRVVGKNGQLTGYGGGLDRKRFLLELEGAPFQVATPSLF